MNLPWHQIRWRTARQRGVYTTPGLQLGRVKEDSPGGGAGFRGGSRRVSEVCETVREKGRRHGYTSQELREIPGTFKNHLSVTG